MWVEHDTDSGAANATGATGVADATDFDFTPDFYAHGPNSHWLEGAAAGGAGILAKETAPRSDGSGGMGKNPGDLDLKGGTADGNSSRLPSTNKGANTGSNGHSDGGHSDGSQFHVPDTNVFDTQGFSNAPGAGVQQDAGGDVAKRASAATQPLPRASILSTGPALLDANGMPIERRVLTTAELSQISHKRRRLNYTSLIVALVALQFLMTAFYSPLLDPMSNQPPRLPDLVPMAEVQPYGVNTFLQKEVESWKKEKTVELADNMGVGWIRQQFPWAEIEYRADHDRPFWDVKNNQNAWDKFDSIVDLAVQHNLRVIARIDNAPVWSHPASPTLKSPPDKVHMEDFANFIGEFVRHYKGRIAAIQIWNEPNLTGEWVVPDPKDKTKSLPVNANDYTEMLKVAYKAAKEADPNMIVLAAPLATTNDTQSNLNEMQYLQGMYDAGAQNYFDVMSANAYGKSDPPEDPPSIEKLNFRRVELLHNIMLKNGDDKKAVWFNEYGWNASPPTDQPPHIKDFRWGRVTPEQQSEYTVRGIEYARKNWPWAGVFTIWYLRQVGDIADTDSEYYFGMVNPEFVVSPLYKAVAVAATHTQKVATPGEWGPLSSPVQAGSDWRIELNPAVPGGMYVVPATVTGTLETAFHGTDVKVMLVPPSETGVITGTNVAARYYVTVDGKSDEVSNALPRDGQRRAYIDVPAGGQATEVTLVSGLGAEFRTTQHTLRIQVGRANEGNGAAQTGKVGGLYAPLDRHIDLPGIGTIQVAIHSSYLLFALASALVLAAIAFCFWGLTRNGSGRAIAQARRR